MSSNPEGARGYVPFVIIGVVLAAVVVGVVLMTRSNNANGGSAFSGNSGANPAQTPQGTLPANSTVPPRQPLPGAPNPPARGGEHAAVTMEEFSDFQCPACGGLDPALRRISKDYGERVRWVFRNFPLTTIHKYAFIAARAAEAAGAQGRFWEMHDLLFENQGEWSVVEPARPVFVGYARRLGLEADRFGRDMDAPETRARVEADLRRADTASVGATPTLFLEGRELSGSEWTPEGLRAAVDAALKGRRP